MRLRYWLFLGIVFCPAVNSALSAQTGQSESSAEEFLARIQQQIQAGDLRSARNELKQALSQLPRDPRLFNLLGVIEAQEKNFTAAESNFRRAIQAAPRFSGAYLNLGRLYQENSGDPRTRERALSVYQTLLKYEPDHVEGNYQAAWLLNRLGKYADSLQRLARLPAESRQRSQALTLECANNAALGRLAQAEAAGKRLLASADLAEADVLAIEATLSEHHAEDLVVRLLDGLAIRGLASGHTLRKLAVVHEEHGRFKEARAALEKSLQLEQSSAGLLSQLARLAYRAGDLEGALGYLAHARDLEPRNAAVHFFFGMICVELKLPPEAKKSLQDAVRLDPENPYYNYALGAVLVNEKNAEDAVPYFRKYREARPGDPRGGFALGFAYYEAYQMDSARKEFMAVANRPETRLGAQLYLGRLAIREGNLDEAMNHLQQAIQANSSSPEPYAESGLVHIRRNEYALAENDLARALKLAPDHYLSNLRLLMLYQRTKDPRAKAQARRIERLQQAGEEKERLLLRSLEIRPY